MISCTIVLNFSFPFYYFSLNSSVSFVFHHEYTTILNTFIFVCDNETKRTNETDSIITTSKRHTHPE